MRRTLRQAVDTVAFVDGSEQRCASSRALHEWTIRYICLDEQEMEALHIFAEQAQGQAGTFSFTDPQDGVQYPSCSLALQVLDETFAEPGRINAIVVIRENPK
ncbi:MAG TPA: DUF2460 domain-containing protein [Bryobacteraceae bacterium]